MEPLGRSWGSLWVLGALLRGLGRSWRRPGGLWDASWTLLEASWSLLEVILGAQEASGWKTNETNGPVAQGNSAPRGGVGGGDTLEECTGFAECSHSLQHPDKQG